MSIFKLMLQEAFPPGTWVRISPKQAKEHNHNTTFLEAETMANKSQKPAPKSAPKKAAKKEQAPAKKTGKK